VIAHRGVSISSPENSRQAFQSAVDLGIAAVEIDVYLTRDDSVMVFHDVDVNRLTGLTGVVGSFTAAQLRAGVLATTGGEAMTFGQFVEEFGTRFAAVYVDVKEGQGLDTMVLVAKRIRALALGRGLDGLVIATSTQFAPLDTLLSLDSGFPVAIEIGGWEEYMGKVRTYPRLLISHLKLSPTSYETVKASGAKLITFTPNTLAEFQAAVNNGCDAIITDHPLELKKYLATSR